MEGGSDCARYLADDPFCAVADSSDVGADAEIRCPFPQLHISDLMEVSFTSALRKVFGKNGLNAATSAK
jgi:hypothetical protein